jgi:hypothetical protein
MPISLRKHKNLNKACKQYPEGFRHERYTKTFLGRSTTTLLEMISFYVGIASLSKNRFGEKLSHFIFLVRV